MELELIITILYIFTLIFERTFTPRMDLFIRIGSIKGVACYTGQEVVIHFSDIAI